MRTCHAMPASSCPHSRAATNSLRRQQHLARCFVGQDLSRVATADGGWSWTDEGRSKWGFLSDTAGAALKLMFNSEMHGPREVNASVRIAFLQTYTPMGIAKVSCIAGCSCDESAIENMWQPGEHTVSAMLPRLHLRHATWLSARVHLKLYIGHTKDCPRLVRLWLMCGASTSAPLVYTILLTLPAPSSPGLPIPPSPPAVPDAHAHRGCEPEPAVHHAGGGARADRLGRPQG